MGCCGVMGNELCVGFDIMVEDISRIGVIRQKEARPEGNRW